MNICLVITGLTMGGAERQVCDLADQFVQMGHRVKIVSLNKEPVVLPRVPEVMVTSLLIQKTVFGLLAGLVSLRKEITDFNPDIVHSHMVHANILCRILRIMTPMNVLICTAHNINEGGKLRELMYRYTDRLSTISTNVSQEAVDTYIKNRVSFDNRMIPVDNGIDETRFRYSAENRKYYRKLINLDTNDFLFMAVGRLEKQKDYHNLIRAFSMLTNKSANNNYHLAIIGEGSLKCELMKYTSMLGLNSKVYFLNNQSNVNEWMSACDAYVLSSAWEGFGLVVAEAMLCERVVVATDCGGVKQVLGNGGILVPPESSELLCVGMRKVILLGKERKKKLGIISRDHIITNYSLSGIANKWIDIYKDCNSGKLPLVDTGCL